MRGTLPPRSPARGLPALSLERVQCNSAQVSRLFEGQTCAFFTQTGTPGALGVMLVLSGLAVAAFAVRTGVSDNGDVADVGRPAGAAGPGPGASVSQVVYFATTRPACVPTAAPAQGAAGAAKIDLVGRLQRELARIGCYRGDINGLWTRSTRRAMEALIERVNAKLPTAQPEAVHLALAQAQNARLCEECATGEEHKSFARCANRAGVATLAATVAPVLPPERMGGKAGKRWQAPRPREAARAPTQGRMGLGVSSSLTEPAERAAKRRLADHGSRTNHRTGRHRMFGAHKPPQYLRPMRPMRYARRRWGGIFAVLLGW